MNNPLENVKPNRETNFTKVKQVRCNVALLNQAISAAEAESGIRFTQRDILNCALAEFVDRRREAMVRDAIERVENYS